MKTIHRIAYILLITSFIVVCKEPLGVLLYSMYKHIY